MHELIPYTPRRSPLKTDLFLFSTTHGQAHIGFSLNDYCYISPESFEQDLVAGSPAEWEYMYELFRDAKGVWEGERNTFRALEHLLGFRIVLASS